MISWMTQLCSICAVSALAQMILPQEEGSDGIRLLCGMMMLRLTCETAQTLLQKLAACSDMGQLLSCLIN